MLVGNPFSGTNVKDPGVPGNTSTPQPPAPPGSRQSDNTNDQNNRSALVPGDDEEIVDGKIQKKKGNTGLGDELSPTSDKLWENEPRDPNAPDPDEDSGYLPKIKPEDLQKRIGQIDFKKAIKPEQIEALKAGGDGAVAAQMDILNTVGQQIMLTAFTATQNMIERGLTTAEGKFLGKVPNHVKDIMIEDGLTSSNKIMKDARFAPQVEAVRRRFQQKFPKATPKAIENAVNAHFDEMVKLATAKPTTNPDDESLENDKALKMGSPTADWENWFATDAGAKR